MDQHSRSPGGGGGGGGPECEVLPWINIPGGRGGAGRGGL